MTDAQFLKEIDDLCSVYVATEPEWVAAMKSNPVVYAPHKAYFQSTGEVACCKFRLTHPIHTLRKN